MTLKASGSDSEDFQGNLLGKFVAKLKIRLEKLSIEIVGKFLVDFLLKI
jgi:hypothetical protein